MYQTLAQVREDLWKYASPINYAASTASEKADVDRIINLVCKRFFDRGKFRGMIVRATFAVFDSTITLPSGLETILGARSINSSGEVTGGTISLRNQWYEFSHNVGCWSGWPGLVDLGDGWPTFRTSPYERFTIKAVPDGTEPGTATFLLRGRDEDGNQIYSSATEGVSLGINSVTPAETTQVFTSLDYWVKSAATNTVVRLYAVDEDTDETTIIAIIPPNVRMSNLRRYAVPCDWSDPIEVVAKRAWQRAVNDNDPVIPSNLGALKHGIQAWIFEDKVDRDKAREAWNEAFEILDQELTEFDGDSALPTIQADAGYFGGTIANVM